MEVVRVEAKLMEAFLTKSLILILATSFLAIQLQLITIVI